MAADRVLAGFGVWDFVSLGSTVQGFIPNAAPVLVDDGHSGLQLGPGGRRLRRHPGNRRSILIGGIEL